MATGGATARLLLL